MSTSPQPRKSAGTTDGGQFDRKVNALQDDELFDGDEFDAAAAWLDEHGTADGGDTAEEGDSLVCGWTTTTPSAEFMALDTSLVLVDGDTNLALTGAERERFLTETLASYEHYAAPARRIHKKPEDTEAEFIADRAANGSNVVVGIINFRGEVASDMASIASHLEGQREHQMLRARSARYTDDAQGRARRDADAGALLEAHAMLVRRGERKGWAQEADDLAGETIESLIHFAGREGVKVAIKTSVTGVASVMHGRTISRAIAARDAGRDQTSTRKVSGSAVAKSIALAAWRNQFAQANGREPGINDERAAGFDLATMPGKTLGLPEKYGDDGEFTGEYNEAGMHGIWADASFDSTADAALESATGGRRYTYEHAASINITKVRWADVQKLDRRLDGCTPPKVLKDGEPAQMRRAIPSDDAVRELATQFLSGGPRAGEAAAVFTRVFGAQTPTARRDLAQVLTDVPGPYALFDAAVRAATRKKPKKEQVPYVTLVETEERRAA